MAEGCNDGGYEVCGLPLKKSANGLDLPTAATLRAGTAYGLHDSKLCVLEHSERKKGAWLGVRDQLGCVCFFRMSGRAFELFPSRTYAHDKQKPDDRVDVTAQFVMTAIDPGLRIKYTVYRGARVDKRPVHSGAITFYLGSRYHSTDKPSYHGIMPNTWKVDINPDDTMDISFRSEGAEAAQLDLPIGIHAATTTEEVQIIELLRDYTNNDGCIDVHLKLEPFRSGNDAKDVTIRAHAMAQSWASASSSMIVAERPFWQYKRTGSDDVRLDFNSEKSRFDIVNTLPYAPLVAHGIHGRFNSPEHGKVVLGYGIINEWNEQVRAQQALQQIEHDCYLVKIEEGQDKAVLVGIKFSTVPETGLGEKRNCSVPANSYVTAKVLSCVADGVINVKGITIENELSLSHADITVICVGCNAEALISSFSRFQGSGMRTGMKSRCTFQVKTKDTTIKAQLAAITYSYNTGREKGTPSPLLPLLLYDGTRRATTNSFDRIGNPEKRKAALAFLLSPSSGSKSWQWTASQRNVIDGCQKLIERVQIVLGPAGAGKTAIQIMKIIAFAVHGGQYGLITSNRNSVLDNILDVMTCLFKDLRPVRVYTKVLSLAQVVSDNEVPTQVASAISTNEPEDTPELGGEELSIYEILAQRMNEQYAKPHSVEAHVMQHIKDGTRFYCQFTAGLNLNGSPKSHPEHADEVEMFAFLKSCFDEVKDHPLHELVTVDQRDASLRAANAMPSALSKYWTIDKIELFSQALNFCRQYVIINADILITTVINCASDEVRKHFATDKKRGIVVECDEAFSIYEQSILVALSTGDWVDRIISVGLYGDDQQLRPSATGKSHMYNAEFPGLNEFGAQLRTPLVARLKIAGFPVHQLTEQSRMHPVVFAPANAFFYNSKCTTMVDDEVKWVLPPFWDRLVRSIHNCSKDTILSAQQQRLLWLQVSGDTMVQSSTGSKGNWATFSKVFGLIRGPLHKYFGKNMNRQVCILVPYNLQLRTYSAAFAALRSKEGWSADDLPQLLTIDSAIGTECAHAIVDLTIHSLDNHGQGFVKDPARVCVLATRGMKSLWIVAACKTRARYAAFATVVEEDPVKDPVGKLGCYKKYLTEAGCFVAGEDSGEKTDLLDAPYELWNKMELDALKIHRKRPGEMETMDKGAGDVSTRADDAFRMSRLTSSDKDEIRRIIKDAAANAAELERLAAEG